MVDNTVPRMSLPFKPRGLVAIIYGLIDPRTGELRYIGLTKRELHVRLYGHICDKRASTLKVIWIHELCQFGLVPELVEIERVDFDGCFQAELFWITYFLGAGARLTNINIGRCTRRVVFSEQRRKLLEASEIEQVRNQRLLNHQKVDEERGTKAWRDIHEARIRSRRKPSWRIEDKKDLDIDRGLRWRTKTRSPLTSSSVHQKPIAKKKKNPLPIWLEDYRLGIYGDANTPKEPIIAKPARARLPKLSDLSPFQREQVTILVQKRIDEYHRKTAGR